MGWGWVGGDMSSSSARSDPQRPKRPPATARRTMLRRRGPRHREATYVLHQLLFRQLCGQKKSRRQCPKSNCSNLKQRTVHLPMRAQLHLPPLDLAWDHPGCDSVALRTVPPTPASCDLGPRRYLSGNNSALNKMK